MINFRITKDNGLVTVGAAERRSWIDVIDPDREELSLLEREYGITAAQAFEDVKRGADDFTEWTVAQLFILAGAQQQNTLGFKVWQAVQQQALAGFAGDVATLEYRADGAVSEFVNGFGGMAELAAFTDGDHESGRFQRFWADAFYNQFHVRVPESNGQRAHKRCRLLA